MPDIKVSIHVESGTTKKTYPLNMTQEAAKNEKTGRTTLAHFQPAAGNQVVKGFSKVYLDTEELAKAGQKDS